MDANSILLGDDTEMLPETYVIFITENDVLEGALPIYHIDRTIKETGALFHDKAHIIYVNGEIKGDIPLGRLMHNLSCADPDDMNYKELADRARYFKRDKEGQEIMSKAMSDIVKPVYTDRYLMPAEIKKAVSECSMDKIGEIRDEMKALGPIFDKLEHAPAEDKILPFSSDTFQLTQGEEKIMKQEGYLRKDNDRYYLPEIIRHALKFKYGKGARPKVLSLLLK